MKLSSAAHRAVSGAVSGTVPGAAREYGGVLTRLRHDTSGNTLMMIAAASLPLAFMVGAVVDIGRSYMIKGRLQQACDAGVLATRRSMPGSVLDDNSRTQGQNYFNINFTNNTAGATNVSFEPTLVNNNEVNGVAKARVPMTITRAFDADYVDLSLTCTAKIEISNTDVMMVLDVTGSMADCPDDSNCGSGPNSKIAGLRAAVVSFYDTINDKKSTDARFRIGFVPYSSAVNLGTDPFTGQPLLATNWMVDSWTYQSRVANMTRDGWTGTSTFGGWTEETFGSNISNTNCTKYGNNTSFSGYTPANTLDWNTTNSNPNNVQPPQTVYQEAQPSDKRRVYERVSGSWSSGNQSCKRRWRYATTTYVRNGRYAFESWDYKPVTYNVSTYRAGTPVNAYTSSADPTGSVTASGSYNMVDLLTAPGSDVIGTSTAYDGCVEERDTVAQSIYTTIPAGAYDLDILTTPFNDATRWRPMWQELAYDRDSVSNEIGVSTGRSYVTNSWCPVPASKLAVRTHANVQDYVDDLIANGNTFHDLGMAWGARMLSPTGMWASENATAPNGKPINRNLIFMTDGMMVTPPNIYNAHGYEELDRRVSGSSNTPNQSDLVNRHNARFQALCNAAKNNNITVWTIAFGTSNPATLISCATAGKSFIATDSATLKSKFEEIAAQIAELRLTK